MITQRNGIGQIFDSYSPLRSGIRGRAVGGFKSMENGTAYCGCCIAIGAAGTALVPTAAARETENGIELGMYLPGRIRAAVSDTAVTLLTQTIYPSDGAVFIVVNPEKEIEFDLSLRIPSFAEAVQILVNGEVQKLPEQVAGTFVHLKRVWKAGDQITISMKWGLRLVTGMENAEDPASSKQVAVLYGALALARDKRLGEEGTPVDLKEGTFTAQKVSISLPNQCAFRIKTNQPEFVMIDYASAGKTWRRDSEMEVWMQQRD